MAYRQRTQTAKRRAEVKRQTERDPYRGRDPRVVPAYNIDAAARYLRIPDRTIRNWAYGQSVPSSNGGRRTTRPLIDVADRKQYLLSFFNLVELHVLGALRRQHNVQMPRIRRAIDYLQEKLRTAHPLIAEEMATDGISIFLSKAELLINVSEHGQLGIEAVLRAYLQRIDRDPQGIARRLFPITRTNSGTVDAVVDQPRFIAIDPRVAFGRPVIAGSRVPTSEIFERFNAGDSPDDLAADFRRTPEEIWEAIRCEAAAA